MFEKGNKERKRKRRERKSECDWYIDVSQIGILLNYHHLLYPIESITCSKDSPHDIITMYYQNYLFSRFELFLCHTLFMNSADGISIAVHSYDLCVRKDCNGLLIKLSKIFITGTQLFIYGQNQIAITHFSAAEEANARE